MDEVRMAKDNTAYTWVQFQNYYGAHAERRWDQARRSNPEEDVANTTPASAAQPGRTSMTQAFTDHQKTLKLMLKWDEVPHWMSIHEKDWGLEAFCELCHKWSDDKHLGSALHKKREVNSKAYVHPETNEINISTVSRGGLPELLHGPESEPQAEPGPHTTPASAAQPGRSSMIMAQATPPQRGESARLTAMVAIEKRRCMRRRLQQLSAQTCEPQIAVAASTVLAVPSAPSAQPTWRYCHERAMYFSLSGDDVRHLPPLGAAWAEDF